MKIALTSTGNSLESKIDKRFGRCRYFVIYETETRSIEFIPNHYRNQEEDSGVMSVQFLESRNVSKIISGEFGSKIKSLLDSLRIQLIIYQAYEKNIGQIIKMLNH